MMTKTQAISLFGSAAKLAAALGITRSAVSQWDDTKPIPQEHYLRIRYELKPRQHTRRKPQSKVAA